jgi:hypothetical protein
MRQKIITSFPEGKNAEIPIQALYG